MKSKLLKNEFVLFKNAILALTILLISAVSYGQCTFPPTSSKVGNDYTFCVDTNTNSITTAIVKDKQHVVLNVVKGFIYNFSVGNVFNNTVNERLTVFDGGNTSLITNFGQSGTTISNWTATISGQVKILLSTGNCDNNTATGLEITLTLVSIGNTLDSKTAAGVSNWVGHVYNWTGTAPAGGATSPTSVSNTGPFVDANYVGYYNTVNQTINENFGGNFSCFSVWSDGAVRSQIYAETFAVRYRMKPNLSGYFLMNVGGDDGVRVYVDNVLVFNQWREQSYTNYCNNLLFLNSNSEIVLEYYENGGGNTVTFSMSPVGTTNNISDTAVRTICANTAETLTGSTYQCTSSTGFVYQWQASDNNTSFTNIASATSANYTVPASNPATNQTKYYRRLLKASGSSTNGSPSNTITVNTIVQSIGGTVTSSKNVCIGSNSGVLTISGNTGSVIRWESSVTPFNTWNAISNTTNTYTSGNLSQTTQFRAVVKFATCGVTEANSFPATITVNPASVGGTISGGGTACPGTNSGTLYLGGNVGSVIRWESSISPFTTWTTINNTTATHNPGILTQTTQFRAVVKSGACSEINSAVASAGPGNTTTWNGSQWNDGAPTFSSVAIISGNYNLAENINACSLTVNSTAVVVIPTGYTVNLNGAITVEDGSSFTLENNASLIQNGASNTNSGNITVKRYSSALKRLDYTLWSSPTSGTSTQTLQNFSPLTTANRFYIYKTDTNLYSAVTAPESTTFSTAKGYLIRMPNTHPTTATVWEAGAFTGIPNNGNYNLVMTNIEAGKRFNLVGNPYPSPIDAATFLTANTGNIKNTLYFWRKTNDATQPSYYTWTTAGLNGPVTTPPTTTDQTFVAPFEGVIQTGQGFFVEALENATELVFNNTMRKDDHANQFYKSSEESAVEYNRIWLNATNAAGWSSQTLIAYFTDGTNDLDSSDGKYINDGDIAFTSLIQGVPYAIQGKALPFSTTDTVPMHLTVKNAGAYTVAIDHVDGLFEGAQSIYLRDNQTNTDHDLKTSSYTFNSEAGSFSSRFSIVYESTLGVTNPNLDANSILISKNNSTININAGNYNIENVEVFDLLGRKMYESKKVNSNTASISNLSVAEQVILIKVTTNQGTVTKKMIF